MNMNEDRYMEGDGQQISEGFIKVVSIHKYDQKGLSKVMKLLDVGSQPYESMRLIHFLQTAMNI
jgi:hypothetical protein